MGGGKGGGATDNSMELYQQQQADLARQRAENEAKERAQQEAEQARRDELRQQMLGSQITTDDDEDGDYSIQKNVLS